MKQFVEKHAAKRVKGRTVVDPQVLRRTIEFAMALPERKGKERIFLKTKISTHTSHQARKLE